ncbi:hypothetical protein POVWA2_050090 [Plasmodium ovale wallikeri]|uniref:Uncharacterized protein n=1 Tax=Plasmodium ovale wallikeri TaxID=864142 RepID=A0A1A8ZN29_PLAOA|nr:hypothetical protein POVWA2_050090 [Plasmodium ovale wallikeri]
METPLHAPRHTVPHRLLANVGGRPLLTSSHLFSLPPILRIIPFLYIRTKVPIHAFRKAAIGGRFTIAAISSTVSPCESFLWRVTFGLNTQKKKKKKKKKKGRDINIRTCCKTYHG